MFKHYLITRLSEQDEVLRARYIANEKIFALVLGIVPEGSVLTSHLLFALSVHPESLSGFVIWSQVEQVALSFVNVTMSSSSSSSSQGSLGVSLNGFQPNARGVLTPMRPGEED